MQLDVLTVGYGNRSWVQFAELLRAHAVTLIIDVRSRPFSKNIDFSAQRLPQLAERAALRYEFMGDRLGGKPEDGPTTTEGHVDYRALESTHSFQNGLRRMYAHARRGERVVLMCSELRPEQCHRMKLIGEALTRKGVSVGHIDADGRILSQGEAVDRLTKGQQTLGGVHAFIDWSRGRVV